MSVVVQVVSAISLYQQECVSAFSQVTAWCDFGSMLEELDAGPVGFRSVIRLENCHLTYLDVIF